MCGIVGLVSHAPVNQMLYDALLLLQHRGQDAAGIATSNSGTFSMYKANGLVRDVFRTRNMRSLLGNSGIGHVRYPTAGSSSEEEAQPFYVNAPFGITLAHNGNLTNWEHLKQDMFTNDRRHINTNSDSEVLLNVLAHEIQEASSGTTLDPAALFKAVRVLHKRVRGAYAAVAQISGHGLLAFRDPFGIRPLCYGIMETESGKSEYMVASESVALEGMGYRFVRDIAPGEAIFIDLDGGVHTEQCHDNPTLNICAFEYVYLARPDSVIDGASVYATRLRMGEYLADKIKQQFSAGDIDVVMPIPDSSRPAAIQLALKLGIEYREGFIKNRYIGRTFIMPGQAMRKKSVRQKLNAIGAEFKGKTVLLVDDSIVRGTTSREIVQMARESGAKKVIFASAAPPVLYPNVYGIDMPTRDELIAFGRSHEEICREITADALVYQDVDALKRSIYDVNPELQSFEASCFDGIYVTGDVTPQYLDRLEFARHHPTKSVIEDATRTQLNLNKATTEQ
ncbi:amidophosphoribosyltransferase [Massilia sp. TS11]|uniref:amidophosphoribosyltransferase n=1 Tax=Massilia sp. TS11 TaxID=2908003 RepID=UPI001EDB5F79|nr:amidophosphoribosyltransferase [Massilia sp. TS11]MCG2583014.1 amidophosphoribosyltransferase [Massilia sp. TS11]